MGKASRKIKQLTVLLFLALLATAIYSNTFSASFHFDDIYNIVENAWIKDLKNLRDLSHSRYVGFLTFALNYHFSGLDVFGYHLVNLIIHIINAFLVYSLVLLLFKIPINPSHPQYPASSISDPSSWIALATALLFVAHPIQTQAVTYIVQRFASLATLFYLLTVVCYLQWRLTPSRAKGRSLWYAVALICTVLAMRTKEITFTLPFMLLLVEAAFFQPLTRKSFMALIPFLLTLPIIPLTPRPGHAGLTRITTEISRLDYLFTQFRVIVTYLRLLIFPAHQNLDYDYPIYHSLFHPAVFLSFLFLLSLFGLATYLLVNSSRSTVRSLTENKVRSYTRLTTHDSRLISFGILWFFITLSIESSIITLGTVIFEHRLYLPSVGIFFSLTMGLFILLKTSNKRFYIIVSCITVILCVLTYQRNNIWKDPLTLWKDVVMKSPMSGRAHNNLGQSYYELGETDKALKEYLTAIELDPQHAEAHNNLGILYKDLGKQEESFREYQTALRLQPNSAQIHYNLANAYRINGKFKRAQDHYERTTRLDPYHAQAYNNLGFVYENQGKLNEAFESYRRAIQIREDYALPHFNLARIYNSQGRLDEAIIEYETGIRLDPKNAKSHYFLGLVYDDLDRWDDARNEFKKALRLDPDFSSARKSLESLPD